MPVSTRIARAPQPSQAKRRLSTPTPPGRAASSKVRRAGTTAANMKTCDPTQVAAAKRWIQKTMDSPMARLLDDGIDDDGLVPLGPHRHQVDLAADELLDAGHGRVHC